MIVSPDGETVLAKAETGPAFTVIPDEVTVREPLVTVTFFVPLVLRATVTYPTPLVMVAEGRVAWESFEVNVAELV